MMHLQKPIFKPLESFAEYSTRRTLARQLKLNSLIKLLWLKLTLIETVNKSQVLYTTRFKDFNNKHTLSIKKNVST